MASRYDLVIVGMGSAGAKRLCQTRVKGADATMPEWELSIARQEPRVPCALTDIASTAARSRLQRRTREWFAGRHNRATRVACPFVPLEPVPVACPS